MSRKRKNVDLSCLGSTPEFVKKMLKLGVPPGMYHTSMDEDIPRFERGGGEKVIEGRHNSAIVLGRDRNASLASGYGGKGGTGCGSIDLVAGRLSGLDREKICPDGTILTGPNFAADAARVYITQRGNIDKYFALPKLSAGNSESNSAVAMKADHCRIIGRDSVRIWAGQGEWAGLGWEGELTSQGGKLHENGIIELMAGSARVEDLQPLVLGNNLNLALKDIYRMIKANNGAINSLYKMMQKIWAPLTGAPPTAGVAVPQFAKAIVGDFNNILSEFNAIIREINATGMGEETRIPGWNDILSTCVFTN